MEDRTADVVVVGSGAAGMAVAITAAHAGATVVVVERASHVGGTTAKSGGAVWIPNNRLMREAGHKDPREDVLRYMARTAYPHLFDPSSRVLGMPGHVFGLLETFYDEGPLALDFLLEVGALQLDLTMTPSYSADLESEVRIGRTLSPTDKPARKVDGPGGDVLIARMARVAEGLGVEFLLDHRVVALRHGDDEDVVGVEAEHGSTRQLIRARRGVVFASGGFLHDPDLRREFLRGPVFGGCAAETNTGDFVRIATKAGAGLGNMGHAWWSQVVLEWVIRAPATIRDIPLPFGDSMIHVNRYGRRVVNEKMPYNERVQAHFHWNAAAREYSNLLLFMVYDDAVAQDPLDVVMRMPTPLPGEANDYVISGATWEELAQNIDRRLAQVAAHTGGLRLDVGFLSTLEGTLARWNTAADAGVDRDFGRGETPIQVAWSQTTRGGGRNPTMHAFRGTGPYHCIIVAPGCLDTKGGPSVDRDGRVLRVDGSPIAGLYGAGNCVASPAGQAYWGPGGTIGPAIVFGHIAGRNAAREPARQG